MHILAEKYDLVAEYSYWAKMHTLGITLYSGSNIFQENRIVDSDAKMEGLLQEIESLGSGFILDKNLMMQGDIYCQTRDMTNRIYAYLRSERIRDGIIQANPFRSRYKNNNDIFVHIRLGDVADKNPGFTYYEKVLNSLESYDRIFLSSDSPNHPICQKILMGFRNTSFIQVDEIQTIQFATTCRNIVLSHGSFSAVIGYLAFFSEVYYPAYDESKRWYGDMFSVPGFQRID